MIDFKAWALGTQTPTLGIVDRSKEVALDFGRWITASDPISLPQTMQDKAVRSFKIVVHELLQATVGDRPKALKVSLSQRVHVFIRNTIKVALFASQLPILILTGAMAWFAAPLCGVSTWLTLPLWGAAALSLVKIELKLEKPKPNPLSISKRAIRWMKINAHNSVEACIGSKPKSEFRSGLTRAVVIMRRIAALVAAGVFASAAAYGVGLGLQQLAIRMALTAVRSTASWATGLNASSSAIAAAGNVICEIAQRVFLAFTVPTYGALYTLPKWLIEEALPKLFFIASHSMTRLDQGLPSIVNDTRAFARVAYASARDAINFSAQVLTPAASKLIEAIVWVADGIMDQLGVLVPAVAENIHWTASNVLKPALKAVAATAAWVWSKGYLWTLLGFL